jgi:hypothetical protein
VTQKMDPVSEFDLFIQFQHRHVQVVI